MQTNVLEYFERGALAHARGKIAVVDGDTKCTFEALFRLAKTCAFAILRRRELSNSPIAVLLPKGLGTIVADLGILYSGNCYANLDVKSPNARLRSIIENLDAPLLITSREFAASLAEL